MIPQKIWQTWKKPYAELPTVKNNNLKLLTETWKALNPGYAYYYCDDEACLNMVKQSDEELYECILECDRVNVVSMKSDIFRYFVLYTHGGYYADIDTVCYAPIDSWIKPGCRFILSPEDNSLFFQQWFLGAQQGHPLLKALLDNIKQKFKAGIDYTNPAFVHVSTGPEIFTNTILDYLKITRQNRLREMSPEYNHLQSLKDAGVYIYADYRYFRDGAPHGVVEHLFASVSWFEENYQNWRTQREVVNALPENKFRIISSHKSTKSNWWPRFIS